MKKKIIICSILLNFLLSAACHAEVELEYQIKAAFLYKFLFFTQWPDNAFAENDSPILIGITGQDFFEDIFKEIESEPVNGKKLIIKRFGKNTSPKSLGKCHILFITSTFGAKTPDLIKSLKTYPVVTVSEIDGFLQMGGMINFVKKEKRVAFEINQKAAMEAGIKFRSKLLRVATRVIGKSYDRGK